MLVSLFKLIVFFLQIFLFFQWIWNLCYCFILIQLFFYLLYILSYISVLYVNFVYYIIIFLLLSGFYFYFQKNGINARSYSLYLIMFFSSSLNLLHNTWHWIMQAVFSNKCYQIRSILQPASLRPASNKAMSRLEWKENIPTTASLARLFLRQSLRPN